MPAVEINRYDFSYWPPVPIEGLGVLPAQSAEQDELCRGLLYIPDPQRLKAVYATGDWVDIQDFWLAADPPREKEAYDDITFEDLPEFLKPPQKIRSRYHLGGPSYAFTRLAYDAAYYGLCDKLPDDKELSEEEFSQTGVYKLLFYKIFNQGDKAYDRRHLLVERNQVVKINEGAFELPIGAGKGSGVFYRRVAECASVFMHNVVAADLDLFKTD